MRHGATAWNIEDRFQGTTDTVLHEIGKEQALTNAKVVEILMRTGRLAPETISIVSSPLSRAQQSAQIVAQHIGVDIEAIRIEPAFREISLGQWEGMNNLKVKEVFYEERQSRKQDRWHFKPKGGESLAERAQEVRTAVKNLAPNTIIIAHAGILRIALHILGNKPEQEAAAAAFPHEGLLHFDGNTLQHHFSG